MNHPLAERIRAGLRSSGAPWILLIPALAVGRDGGNLAPPEVRAAQEPIPSFASDELELATAEIQRVLRRARDPQGPPAADAALELTPFARVGLPFLLEILLERRVPSLGELKPQNLSEIQERIVLATLAGLAPSAVVAQTRSMLAQGRTPAARDAALRILGAIGGPAEVPDLFELAMTPEEDEPPDRLATSFRRAVATLVQREPETVAQIDRRWPHLREPLLLPLLEGLGDAGDPRALGILDGILIRHDSLLVAGLTQIHRIGPSRAPDVNERLARRLRQHLDPSRPACRAAVFALATLRDYDSIPVLIDLLASGSSGQAQDAYHALRRLTGLELRADVELWNSWYHSELAWMGEHAPRVRDQLCSPRHSEVADAIGELARRRLYNDTWAMELAHLLADRTPSLRLLAARALAALRSPYVVADLIEALEDPDRDVRTAAHRALRATTRLDLPPDAAVWRAAWFPTRP